MIWRATLAVVVMTAAHMTSPGPVTSVSIQVSVTDGTGTAITGLEPKDFRVTLDGRPHAIESFSADPGPASAVLLLDATASLDLLLGRGALLTFVEDWLGSRISGDDRWRVGSFAKEVRLGADFTKDRDQLLESARQSLNVPEGERFGPSPVWDAIDAAVTAVDRAEGKRTLVVVTDGRTTGNRLGMQEVMRHALAAGVPVSVIGAASDQMFELGKGSMLLVQPQVALQLLSTTTGGAYLPALQPTTAVQPAPDSEKARASRQPAPHNQLASQLDRILEQLRRSYLLGFSTTADRHKAQTLEVVVNRPGVTVRSRKYVVATGSQ